MPGVCNEHRRAPGSSAGRMSEDFGDARALGQKRLSGS
jgi:hypothetical protein